MGIPVSMSFLGEWVSLVLGPYWGGCPGVGRYAQGAGYVHGAGTQPHGYVQGVGMSRAWVPTPLADT